MLESQTQDVIVTNNKTINFVHVRIQAGGHGWKNFWELGLIDGGAYNPMSFQKYLDIAKKKGFELECD